MTAISNIGITDTDAMFCESGRTDTYWKTPLDMGVVLEQMVPSALTLHNREKRHS